MDTGHWVLRAIPKPVLTVDIVDFSKKSGHEQMRAIRALIKMLNQAIPEDQNNSAARIWSPAGDGGSITFWEDIHAALKTAVSLGKLINEYNKGLADATKLQVRMGLHSGSVTKEKDFDNRENVWGDGMNMSARVASLAKPGQILASEAFYEQADLRTRTKQEVTSIGKWWAKHNKSIKLYNIYIDGAGLPPSEVEEWFGPFQYPLEQAIKTYEAMAEEQASEGPAFRVAVLAKRLLDMNPHHRRAREIIESISEKRFKKALGEKHLYDVFFSSLSPNALLHFFQNAEFRAFEKGDLICEEGDKADSMMMVVSGEIIPSVGGKEIRVPDPRNREGEVDLIFHEGAIIGEMGLFNPGETRTATLQAAKKSITLSLDYHFLRKVEGDGDENKKRAEIRERIWDYYCERTIQNQINSHPLFRMLSGAERNRLLDEGEFLPPRYGELMQIDVNDLWNYWTVVVAGSVTICTVKDCYVECGKGDCLGPIRLAVTELPYAAVEVSSGAQLVRFPWEVIQGFINTSENFYNACMIEAGRARKSLGVVY